MECNKWKNRDNQIESDGGSTDEGAKRKIRDENEDREEEFFRISNKIIKLPILKKGSGKSEVEMTGLKVDTSDPLALKEALNDFVKQHLKVEAKIKTVRKLGPTTCLIEMNNTHKKNKFMQSKAKREREKQKSIRKFAYGERSKGKDVKIGMKKVVVNGTEWRWNKKEERLAETMTKN
ncbi:hypothetical protein ILUMI_21916 [Ignelater luminosus]|uniref:Uncharacterized protein n=1 Tax=Ignelater luminosus TaxID=2038154 RepID=A0A8K0G3A1_IGNLU|nr:hypothetical protein ILUMI_21916 [Ignelater luminosus]